MRELSVDEVREVNGGIGAIGAVIGAIAGGISGAQANGVSGFFTGAALGAVSGALGGWAGSLLAAGYRSMAVVAGTNAVGAGVLAGQPYGGGGAVGSGDTAGGASATRIH